MKRLNLTALFVCSVFLGGTAVLSATSANASPTLIGDTVTAEYIFPTAGTVFGSSNILVGAPFPELTCAAGGPGVCSGFAEPATIDIRALSITLSENAGSSYTAASFNGLDYTNLNFGDGSHLIGFTLLTDLPGLTPADVSFTGNSIAFNGQGLSFVGAPYFITLDLITSTSPTPLPAALPLFATGLAGLGLLGWRRKRKAASCSILADL